MADEDEGKVELALALLLGKPLPVDEADDIE